MRRTLSLLGILLLPLPALAQDEDLKYPLDPQTRVLLENTRDPDYRKRVTQQMLTTDLAAEWQRVETPDSPDNFLKKYGGKDKVLADPGLKRAYERRVQIRNDFLDLMREGYKRYKQTPPFDRGEKAEAAGTTVRNAAAARVALATVLPSPGADKHWPRFRGPSGQGLTGLKALPVTWDKGGTNLRWRVKVPGQGNSSPVVWGDRIFLTSSTAGGKERFVHCLRVADGGALWSQKAPAAPPEPGVRDKNGYASATPVTDGERVIAFLGSCGLVCYDVEGKLLWHRPAGAIKSTHGVGSSPLLYKDLVILIQDQNQSDSVCFAVDKRTGKEVWSQKRKRAMTWCTPVVVRAGARDELLFAGGETVKGYDPATGKELWSLQGPTYEVIPALVIGHDMVYSASGRNGPTLGLRPGGDGDVTASHLVWRSVRSGPHVPTPILVNGRLFTANDHGIATCLDAGNGKLLWQARLPSGFSASPVEAGGLLYFPGESGVTFVLRAADQFEVVARNDLGAPILASPAVAGDCLLIRTQDELVCVGPGKP